MRFDELKTPAYVIDEKMLIHNLEILHKVEEDTGCHILLAQKAFSAYAEYPLIGKYISGTTASGIYEARLLTLLDHAVYDLVVCSICLSVDSFPRTILDLVSYL